MKLALATNNSHKVTEMKAILGSFFDEMLTLKELGIDTDIEETGTTLEENSLIKAKTICEMTGLPALGDDTGLMVDALDGAPGIYSARYAGEAHNDADNRKLLLKNLEGKTDRKAHFCTVITLYYPDGHYITATGRVDGEIATEERGSFGFGYDPLFFSHELNKVFAEGNAEEKNSVSHRGRALRNLMNLLENNK
ncbi:MAG: RdgB/HAM1 family non-canonical purine NTP pyrophosphatase [Clostridia bacterium]|nr:RdgB/HAM1 family non-canonical purine NTP pyrophosphatase [Clostridia bacterium]